MQKPFYPQMNTDERRYCPDTYQYVSGNSKAVVIRAAATCRNNICVNPRSSADTWFLRSVATGIEI
jgi:hypothetical protein